MNAILTIAALTVREAVRRRLVAAFVLISIVLVSVSSWGFYKLSHGTGFTSGETHAALPGALILFMFMFSFVVALSASAIASPAISGEIDSGGRCMMTVSHKTFVKLSAAIPSSSGSAPS